MTQLEHLLAKEVIEASSSPFEFVIGECYGKKGDTPSICVARQGYDHDKHSITPVLDAHV